MYDHFWDMLTHILISVIFWDNQQQYEEEWGNRWSDAADELYGKRRETQSKQIHFFFCIQIKVNEPC